MGGRPRRPGLARTRVLLSYLSLLLLVVGSGGVLIYFKATLAEAGELGSVVLSACASGFAVVRRRRSGRWRVWMIASVLVWGIGVIGGLFSGRPATIAAVVVLTFAGIGAAAAVQDAGDRRRRRRVRGRQRKQDALRALKAEPDESLLVGTALPGDERPRLDVVADGVQPRSIVIVASAADRLIALGMARRFERMGLRVLDDVDAGTVLDSVVLLISSAAVADPRWREGVEWWSGQPTRMVPVRYGAVDAREVPEHAKQLNWVTLDDSEGLARACASIFLITHSDLDAYRRARALSGEADAWERAGRPRSMLIRDERRARSSAELFTADAVSHALIQPNATTRGFVEQSIRRADTRRRWRRGRRGFYAVLYLSAAVSLTGSFLSLLDTLREQRQTVVIANSSLAAAAPEIHGMQATATLIQGPESLRETARREARTTLSTPWSLARVADGSKSSLNDAALIDNGRAIVSVDSAFRIAIWSLPESDVLWSQVSPMGLWTVAATASGSTIAAAGPGGLTVWRGAAHVRRRFPFADAKDTGKVVLSPDGRQAAVATSNGHVIVLRTADGGTLADRSYSRVLALRALAGGTFAAVVAARPGELAVVDARSGRALRRVSVHGTASVANVGPDGHSIVAVDDRRQLLAAIGDGELRAVGIPEPEVPFTLAMPSPGMAIVGDNAYGTRAVDLRQGLSLDTLCSRGISAIRLSGQGLLCVSNDRIELERVPALPQQTGPAALQPPRVETGGYIVEGTADGSLVLRTGSGSRLATLSRVLESPVTALSSITTEPTVIAGAADGEVVEVTFSPRTHVGSVAWRWQVPSGAAVASLAGTTADDSRTVETIDGSVWHVDSCGGCAFDDSYLIDRVRARIAGRCYPGLNLRYVGDRARAVLQIHPCDFKLAS